MKKTFSILFLLELPPKSKTILNSLSLLLKEYFYKFKPKLILIPGIKQLSHIIEHLLSVYLPFLKETLKKCQLSQLLQSF